jgi:hypothetical protein
MAAPITFVIPGVRADRGATRGAGGAAFPIGRAKDSITVTAQRSAGESEVRTTAIPGEDVVLIEVAGGPGLWLHRDTARDLLQSQQDDAIEKMWTCYKAAETLAKEATSATAQPLFYPAMNRIAAQLALDDAKSQGAIDHDTIPLVLTSMHAVPPDFWSGRRGSPPRRRSRRPSPVRNGEGPAMQRHDAS